VEGIRVGLKFKRLHILHGTGWGAAPEVSDGTHIGSYVVHYYDGSTVEIPMEYGVHVRDWYARWGDSSEVSGGKVAWTGENPLSPIRLYTMTWENPHPDKIVTTIDFTSPDTVCAPFLVAMTAEETTPATPHVTDIYHDEPAPPPPATGVREEAGGSVEPAREKPSPAEKGTFVVTNRAALAESSGEALAKVMNACVSLLDGKGERILDASGAYQKQFGKALAVSGHPTNEAMEKARWLRDWLSKRVAPGSTIVLLGDEKSLPTWEVRLGGKSVTTDSLYSDLNGDGVPDTAVARILGEPDGMIWQLQGKRDYGSKAVILCSEDTRIHLETRAFAKSLSQLGYEVAIRGARDDEALSACDFIVHFGHGSPSGISNRFGETFVSDAEMPALARSPIVFVDGCGTLPVGSPLLRSFLKQGAVAYVGSTATVQGMIPARFTNELVEHFLRILGEQPRWHLPQMLMAARAAYVQGHPGLAEKLRQLAATGRINASGDELTHLLTVAEWVYYGDPKATMPKVGPTREMSREVASVGESVRLDETNNSWRTSFATEAGDGQAVLSLYGDIPLSDRGNFRLSVRQNGKEVSLLDSHQDTVYQNIGRDCRGGHISRDTYRARYLIPLTAGEGEQELEVRLVKGSSAVLTDGTEVDIWPPDFEERIGLRPAPAAR